jgi:hypothetical protein
MGDVARSRARNMYGLEDCSSLIDMCVGGGALMHLVGGEIAVGDARGRAPFYVSLRTMLKGASLSAVANGTQGQAGT